MFTKIARSKQVPHVDYLNAKSSIPVKDFGTQGIVTGTCGRSSSEARVLDPPVESLPHAQTPHTAKDSFENVNCAEISRSESNKIVDLLYLLSSVCCCSVCV